MINNGNDTVFAQVSYRSDIKNYRACIFKKQDKVSTYLPDEISGYGYTGDKFFKAGIIDSVFVEVLVSGHMSLYKYLDTFIVEKEGELHKLTSGTIEKEIEGAIKVKEDERWKGTMSFLISDCIENFSKAVHYLDFNENQITKLVIRYNECKGTEYVLYKEDKEWIDVDFGPLAGMRQMIVNLDSKYYDYSSIENHYSSLDPVFGFITDITFPRISEQISLHTEINFSSSNFSGTVERGGSLREVHYTDFSFKTLSVPLALRYTYLQKSLNFYFQVGSHYMNNFDSKVQLISEFTQDGEVYTEEDQIFNIQDQVGIWGGAGLQKVMPDWKLGLELRYYRLTDLTNRTGFIEGSTERLEVCLILLK
ncbi:MAG: outer membrane beta-barrel protein [Bacteroidota bacterium]